MKRIPVIKGVMSDHRQYKEFIWPWHIWVFPKIGIPQNGRFIMENPIRMDDLGVPLFSETSLCVGIWDLWSQTFFSDSRFVESWLKKRKKNTCSFLIRRWFCFYSHLGNSFLNRPLPDPYKALLISNSILFERNDAPNLILLGGHLPVTE